MNDMVDDFFAAASRIASDMRGDAKRAPLLRRWSLGDTGPGFSGNTINIHVVAVFAATRC